MEIYPSQDIARQCGHGNAAPVGGVVLAVEPGSPADDAGFYPGCRITAVNGRVLTDLLVWEWESAGDEVELDYIDGDGDAGMVDLERDIAEPWGLTFDGVIFDRVKLCCNTCTFCFMRQLPDGMRSSLSLRDDDFRLSFLQGTFVTLTNCTPADEERIITERLSPLRVSLHAVDADVRRRIIGRRADHGIEVLDRLLAAGIQVYAQIVLLPGENDGDVLRRTLTWAYERSGIQELGIVPLGFTAEQDRFSRSFDSPGDARAVLDTVRPFEERALAERGQAWVYCADEFYCNAYGAEAALKMPDATFYGDCSMYEDGIGIVRTFLDSWKRACACGQMEELVRAARRAGVTPVLVFGCSVEQFAPAVLAKSPLAGVCEMLFVRNRYFGGNVDVTGLLCGCDICAAVQDYEAFRAEGERGARAPAAVEDSSARFSCSVAASSPGTRRYYLPDLIFNADGLTLDGMTFADMETSGGLPLRVVSCMPEDFIPQMVKDLS